MKKLLVVLALGAFASCGGGETNDATSDTSTIVTQDTQQVVTDTTVTTDTINKK